uniref:Uncharacterized protein n=1 Tax=Spongospora subterranea TaxID=70186 RepID=A0A0H5REX1_9EUKA|eukprot:CRZ12276.1 hypothetical protein [Spongospora subterranea]
MASRRGNHKHKISKTNSDAKSQDHDIEPKQPDWDMLPDAPFNGTGKLLTRKPRRHKQKLDSSQCGKDVNIFDVEEFGSMTAYAVQNVQVELTDERNLSDKE